MNHGGASSRPPPSRTTLHLGPSRTRSQRLVNAPLKVTVEPERTCTGQASPFVAEIVTGFVCVEVPRHRRSADGPETDTTPPPGAPRPNGSSPKA